MSAEQELRERNQAIMNAASPEYGTVNGEEHDVGNIQEGSISNVSVTHSAVYTGDLIVGGGSGGSNYTTNSDSNGTTWHDGSTTSHITAHVVMKTKKSGYCWNPECNREEGARELIFREKGNVDGRYGHKCPICNKSLREHPMFGEGNEYDFGDSKKRRNWGLLNTYEKRAEKKRYKKFKEAV